MIPVGRSPYLVIDGPCLVLRDAYTATVAIRAGDSLKVTGDWKVAPTQSAGEEVVGVAHRGANIGQPVDVVVAGLMQLTAALPVSRGDSLTPNAGTERGRAQPAGLAPTGRAHATAVESQPSAGRPFWAHLRR